MLARFEPFLDEGLGWLILARHELLLFAAFWLVIGAIDELAVDLRWLWLRVRGRARTGRLPEGLAGAALNRRAAVLVAAWREAEVIGPMIAHTFVARQKIATETPRQKLGRMGFCKGAAMAL